MCMSAAKPQNPAVRIGSRSRLRRSKGRAAGTTLLWLATVLTERLACVPTVRLASVLAPIGISAKQVVRVSGQEKESEDVVVGRYRKRRPLYPHHPPFDSDLDSNLPSGGAR
jgi:hypothetical protein